MAAAMQSGEVVKATETTALAITSPSGMKSDGTQEPQSSPAIISQLVQDQEDDEELLLRSLEYDLSMRLIVAHQIHKLKLDMKKDIDIYRSLLRDHDGECDRRRRRLAARRTAAREPDDAKEEEEEEEEETTALREFRDMYAKASDVDRRLEEFDEIVWVHYDPDLDNETRRATMARLWRRLEKELDDRAGTVVSGAFNYTFAPLQPRLQSIG